VSGIEIEVKLRVTDPGGIQRRLTEWGVRLLHAREFEDNWLYDFPDGGLMRRGAMLRLRVLGRAVLLTYKDRSRIESGVKVRGEIETTLPPSEGESLASILSSVGFMTVFRYQKYRTTWGVGGLLIMLDETPIGVYLELEGERPLIDRMATRLGYAPTDFIPKSYRDLYLESSRDCSQPLDRMLFAP